MYDIFVISWTCPVSKRVNSPQCTKIFKSMTETTPLDNRNLTKAKLDEIMRHYHHMFLPNQPIPPKRESFIRPVHRDVVKKPLFHYGLFNSRATPKVSVLKIKPVVLTNVNKPLVLAPVYLRDPKWRITSLHNDGVFRSNPYWLHGRIGQFHFTTPSAVITSTTNRPLPTVTPKTLPTIPTNYEKSFSPLEMIKPDK